MRTDHLREVIESALAHMVWNRVEGALPAPTCSNAGVSDGRLGALLVPEDGAGFGLRGVRRPVDRAAQSNQIITTTVFLFSIHTNLT